MTATLSPSRRARLGAALRVPGDPVASKVPEVAALFWVIKLLTTGAGEAASDFLGNTNLALGAVVGIGGFAWALRMQLRAPAYRARTYWFAVLMVAVFGTIMADVLHVALFLPYPVTSVLYAAALVFVLRRWKQREGSIDIHTVNTRSRERYYWLTVLATFALGTALGDLTAVSVNLGFLPSAFLFGGAILVPLVAWRLGVNPVLTFWAAYVLTRPLGASIADWLGKDKSLSGLALGDGTVVVAALVIIAALVAYADVTRCDVQAANAGPGPELEPMPRSV